jgi:signal peptidase I
MSIKSKFMNHNTDHSKFVAFGMGLLMAAAIVIIFEFLQSADASTSQDAYKIGYEEGCHYALPSMDVKNIPYIHPSNTSGQYQYYKKGYASGTSNLVDGRCLPFASSQLHNGTNNDPNPFYIIKSGSMNPILPTGSLIIANYSNTNFNDSKIGDIVLFKPFDPKENKTMVHRMVKIFQKGDTLDGNSALDNLCEPMIMPNTASEKIIMTKGDANPCSIPGVDIPVTQKNYIGKATYIVFQDNYVKYLIAAIDKLNNLSKTIQNKYDLLNNHSYFNTTMAKITEISLSKFISQINQFNHTDAPTKYSKVQENFEKAFANELKYYQFYNDFLKTNNFITLKSSSDYAFASLNYLTMAYTALTEATSKTALTT